MITAALWFFIVTSGYHSTKHEFRTQEACEAARSNFGAYYHVMPKCIRDGK